MRFRAVFRDPDFGRGTVAQVAVGGAGRPKTFISIEITLNPFDSNAQVPLRNANCSEKGRAEHAGTTFERNRDK